MNYYKRLLGQQQEGGPSLREANEDFARLTESRYGLFGPINDHRARHYR